MQPSAAPLSEQLIIVVLGAPIMAALWWLASRGFGKAVQGGSVSDRTKKRQKKAFWVLLATMNALGFGIILYATLTRS